MRHQRELELKIQLSKAAFTKLTKKVGSTGLSSGPRSTSKLHSVYFDTPKRDLYNAGLSLRVRRIAKGWVQTLKAEQAVKQGLSNPIELESSIESGAPQLEAIPDPNYARTVSKLVGNSELKPLFETRVLRRTQQLKANGSEIELAFDTGEVRTDRKRKAICEAELELRHGTVSDLIVASETLLGDQQVQLATQSKSEQGYTLIGAGKRLKQASGAKRTVTRESSCAEAFSILLDEAAAQILDNKRAIFDSDDSKAPHQLRIGLRRLRSLLKALRAGIDSPMLRTFDVIARDIARSIGELRDADALINAIYSPVAATVREHSGLVELKKGLIQHRNAKQATARSILESERWTRLQLYLALWPRTLDEHDVLQQPISGFASKVLQRTWKKLRKQGRRLDELSIEGRHDMRKRLKQLRYLAEFFAPIFDRDKVTGRFVARLKELQDVFGYVNDVHTAGQLQAISSQNGGASAANYVIGWHEAEARHVWARAKPAWKELRRASTFWK
jgi:triphosphatase